MVRPLVNTLSPCALWRCTDLEMVCCVYRHGCTQSTSDTKQSVYSKRRPSVRKNLDVFGGVGWGISVHLFVFVYVVTLTIWILTCRPRYGYMLHIYEILPPPREKGEKLSQGRAQADRVRSGMRRLSGEDDMLLFFLQCFNIFCRGRMPVPSLEIVSRVLLPTISPGLFNA